MTDKNKAKYDREKNGRISSTEAMQPENNAPDSKIRVVDVQFRNSGKNYYFDPGTLQLQVGQAVIIDTARGQEYGTVAAAPHEVSSRQIVPPLRRVLRVATAEDEKIVAEHCVREKEAFAICQKKVEEHGLDMQLVSAEYAFDGSKLLFFFTADGRVDFRNLVKDLASVFRTRIELRQIGVRDKAKMVGGFGICGRPFCCREFLDDFQPVSIKMAKVQNLSLNPTKISGTCGRLMCCLKYEQEAYEDLLRTSPKAESFVDTPEGRGTVTDVNLLRQSVRVRLEKQPDTIVTCKNEDLYVIRNGKARKTDPPIPDDFAPISGKPRPRPEPEPEFPALEEVRIKGEMPQTETQTAAEHTQHRRRHRRSGKASGAAQTEQRPRQKEKQEPHQSAPAERTAASSGRQPRRRRRHGGGGKKNAPQKRPE